MTALKTGSWIFCLCCLLACFFWYQKSTLPSVHLNTETLATIPDQRIRGLSVQQFDATGQLLHHLKTPLMRHTPNQNTHWFKNPLIRITEPNQPAWEIQSKEAIATNNGEQITFQHEVLIQHHAYKNNAEGIIKTEKISYFPKKKLATTEDKIVWTQAENIVQSMGMHAYLDEHRIDLLNHARASYEPVG